MLLTPPTSFSEMMCRENVASHRSPCLKEGRKEMFYLTTHSTHFIYGYMASDLFGYRTIKLSREETRWRHMGYSLRLAAWVLLYAPSHRQDSTYHGLWYTSRGALAGINETQPSGSKWNADRPCTRLFCALVQELVIEMHPVCLQ